MSGTAWLGYSPLRKHGPGKPKPQDGGAGGPALVAVCPPQHVAAAAAGLAGLLWPRRCVFCGRVIGLADRCEACAAEAETLRCRPPRLDPARHSFGMLDGAAALYRYDGIARDAVLALKYEGAAWNGPELGNLLAEGLFGCTFERRYGILYPKRSAMAAFGWDVIVPVPQTSPERGYHVSLLLAQRVAMATGLPVCPGALVTTKTHRRQADLSAVERIANATGSFRPAAGAAECWRSDECFWWTT